MVALTGQPQGARAAMGLGAFALPAQMVLSIPDSVLDPAPSSVIVYLQGAPVDAEVTFTVGSTDVLTMTAGADMLGPVSIPVDDPAATEIHASAPGAVSQSVAITFSGASPEAPVAPDPDSDPAPVQQVARWELQDVAPGGLGTYVFPANPASMAPLPNSKLLTAEHTTGLDGQYHVTEAAFEPYEWSFAGVGMTKEFHDTIQSYFALNRRFYLVDHHGQAWTVTFIDTDYVPRKRVYVNDVLTDWLADYTITALIYDPTPKTA